MSFNLNTKLQARKKAILTSRFKKRATEQSLLENASENYEEVDREDYERAKSKFYNCFNVREEYKRLLNVLLKAE